MSLNFDWPVIGHANILSFLKTSLKNKRIAHAYLFLGEKNLGKETVARLFFQSLVCVNREKTKDSAIPCQKCEFCLAYKKDGFPDLYTLKRLEEKNQISIEQVRLLLHFLSLRPHSSVYKLVLIKNAEDLSLEAANSLLKILEEPPPNTVFILISENERAVPSTVISRSQLIRFNRVSSAEISAYLKERGLAPNLVRRLTVLAQGRPGLALDLAADNVNYKNYQAKISASLPLFKANIAQKFEAIKKIRSELAVREEGRNQLSEEIGRYQGILRDIIMSHYSLENLIINNSVSGLLKELSSKKKIDNIKTDIKTSFSSQALLKKNINPSLILENFFIKIS
ncbi:MAG: DNA polymerase III subunit delta' [Patescibacteria group bacterium]